MFQLRLIYRGLSNNLLVKSSRTFLSESYQCSEAWKSRLTTPILQKINVDNLYYELEQKFQQKNKASAIDVDLYANKLMDESHLEEAVDLMHKLRMTDETTYTLDSTSHAIIRNYIEHNQISPLLQILNNRLSYGLFLDNFTANLLLNNLIKSSDFKSAARVATLLMLQEDFENEITNALSLYACYRFVKNLEDFSDLAEDAAESAPSEPATKKKKEEIKVRVKYLRNPFYDDHFDITNTSYLVGKTIRLLAKQKDHAFSNSLQLLGLILYDKYEEANKLMADTKIVMYKEIIDLINDRIAKTENVEESKAAVFAEFKANFEKLEKSADIQSDSLESLLIKMVSDAVAQHEGSQIKEQLEIYKNWCDIRQEKLQEEYERLQRAKRLKEIEKLTVEMEKEEQKLWFFENEDQIDLAIDGKKVYYPKRWFGKKKKPKQVDEDYVPPEIRSRN